MNLDLEQISAAVAAARSAPDEFAALVEALSRLATQNMNFRVQFDHHELQLEIGSRGGFARRIDRLKAIEPLELGLAPVVAAVFSANEHDVLVLRYWALPGEQRLRLEQAPKPGEAATRRFRDELSKLAEAGWRHAWATRGTYYWRVGSKTGTLALEDWSVLEPIED